MTITLKSQERIIVALALAAALCVAGMTYLGIAAAAADPGFFVGGVMVLP